MLVKNKKYLVCITAFIMVVVLGGCNLPEGKTKEEVMQERFDRKLSIWLSNYGGRCQESVLDAAAAIVDSTLIANARAARRSNRPPRPPRPGEPEIEIPQDTTPIAPLIDLLLLLGDTAFVDSLLTDSLYMDSLLLDSTYLDSLYLDSLQWESLRLWKRDSIGG